MEPVHYESETYYTNKAKGKSIKVRQNLINENLQEENAELKKELHQLRKMEAGWFGKNKNVVKKEVIVKNNHYLDEKEKISSELTSYRERCMIMEKEKHALL